MSNDDAAARWLRIKQLFAELCDEPAAVQQHRLATVDEDIRGEVSALLDASVSVGDRFERAPAFVLSSMESLVADPVGSRIGVYRIVRELGRGGMGAVYEAQREDDQFQKRVALKTIMAGREFESILRRFRAERQILATLEHRNIAALLDGGVTDDGQPYFVMEYVEGEPIDRYCASRTLGTRQRVELFRQVCGAVQYAHERLVVHRDLKPGNILVGTDGTVKLLDFGIAKVVDPLSSDEDALTRTGALPMTAAYASPEQLRAGPVSTASDIYSLGIVLYELLAGKRPFAPLTAFAQAPQLLDTPIAPPTGDSELDSIVLMALRAEPERRYRSAAALSDDLQRYLAGRPVFAQPDTIGYRTRKFVRRNRLAVAASVVSVMALIAGTVISVRQATVARAERDRAVREAARTLQVTQFFQDVLQSARPQDHGKTFTVVEAIDAAIPRIDSTFANQPDLRAAIKNTLGSTLYDMFLFDRARPLVEDALAIRTQLDHGQPSRERADAMYDLAGIEENQGNAVRAESLFVAALHMYGELTPVDSVEIYHGMTNLASAIMSQGRLQEALAMYARVADRLAVLTPMDSVTRAVSQSNYGLALAQLGRNDEAIPHFRQAATLMEQVRGPNDFRTGAVLQPLAGALLFSGKHAEAEAVARRSWTITSAALGPDNSSTLASLRMLINILADAGRCADALPHARSIVALRGAKLPDTDLSLATAYLYEGWCEAELGDVAHGEAHVREGLVLRQRSMPGNHWAIAQAESMLGAVIAQRGPARRAEAEQLLRRGYAGMVRELAPTHVRVGQARERLIAFYRQTGRADEVQALLREGGPESRPVER